MADKSRPPNAAQLRADIDSGRTGDKVPVSDPAASPLGTDDEAAGVSSRRGVDADMRAAPDPAPGRPSIADDAASTRNADRRPVLIWGGIAVVLCIGAIWLAAAVLG